MANGKFIAYYRVSTAKQGQSGLGLEAQKSSVQAYLNGGEWELVAEFEEIETGKGAKALEKRPELRAALALCKKHGATLLIAKLDRLARNVHFISGLIESGIDFVAADMPQANKVMLQMHAVMSEWERDQISDRTKKALKEAKDAGVQLGATWRQNFRPNLEKRQAAADEFATKLAGTIKGMKLQKMTQVQMVAELNGLNIKAQRGGEWSLIQLQRLMKRIAEIEKRKKEAERESDEIYGSW